MKRFSACSDLRPSSPARQLALLQHPSSPAASADQLHEHNDQGRMSQGTKGHQEGKWRKAAPRMHFLENVAASTLKDSFCRNPL